MTEFYWLTRLDVIFLTSFVVFLSCTLFGVWYIIFSNDSIGNIIARIKWLVIIDVICGLILLFVPSTGEALAIYGLGTTKDWIENNETGKEIPQKALDALDKYLNQKQ